MKVKIAKWGNSLGIRLPKQFVDALDLKPGTTVDLERDGSRLAIETVLERRIPHYRLEDLLAQILERVAPVVAPRAVAPRQVAGEIADREDRLQHVAQDECAVWL